MSMAEKMSNAMGRNSQQTNTDNKQQQQQAGANHGRYDDSLFNVASDNFTIRPIFDDFAGGGEVFEAFFKVGSEAVEEINKRSNGFKFSIHKLYKEDYKNNYSALLIAGTVKGKDNRQYSIFHSLILESTGEAPSPIIENIGNGQQVHLYRSVAQALDGKFIGTAKEQLMKDLRDREAKITSVDGLVVYHGFHFTDEIAIKRVLSISINAVYSEILSLVRNITGEPLSNFNSNPDAKFEITTRFNPDTLMGFDQTGMPYRKDSVIRLSTKVGNQSSRSIHSGDVGETILNINSYTDFEYLIPNIYTYQQPQQQQITQRFMPHQIVTLPETGNRALMTPSILGLITGSVLTLAQNQNWARGFIENSGSSDIGLLNIQGNIEGSENGIGKPINTKDKKLGPQGLFNFISTLVHPSLLISFDVPEAGPSTWYLSILTYAAKGHQGAIAKINTAISMLVGKQFKSQHPMFLTNSVRVHGGYYTEKNERYDLRRITSYLGMAKLIHEKNLSPNLLNDYTRTMHSTQIPAAISAQNRLNLMRELGIDPVVNQMYDRITLHPGWCQDLNMALTGAGFVPYTNNHYGNDDIFQQPGFDWTQFGVDPSIRVTGQPNYYGGHQGWAGGQYRQF